MTAAIRIALVLWLALVPMGLASCGGSGPASPTPRPPSTSPLTAGEYRLTMSSLGASDGCTGGARTEFGPLGNIILELLIRAEGREWIGRPATPGAGDFELRLQPRDDELTAAVTMRGRGEHFLNHIVDQGHVDVSQSTTEAARLVAASPLRVVGRANGEFAYDRPILGRVTCTSATWILERTGQS